jgi:hypothetical protein
MDLKKLFEDQRVFNRQIFDPAAPGSNLIERLRNLGLGAVEEVMEFLRTYEYKPHRRYKGRLQNVAHSHEELIDLFKFWLSLADAAGLEMDKVEELYYAKSRVVRYRFQEEWTAAIDKPCVIVDIDGVLADYYTGMMNWMRGSTEMLVEPWVLDKLLPGTYLNAQTLQMSAGGWRELKHKFRTSGMKRTLPVYKDAKQFLEWCRGMGFLIILVTSRPIDEYPNLFTDTMTWLTNNQLPFDHLWWATEKAARIEEANVLQHAVFAVDDDARYVAQFRLKGVRTYRLDRALTHSDEPMVPTGLAQIIHTESKARSSR